MAFSTAYIESAQALAAGSPIATVTPGSYPFKLRRILAGVRNASGSPVNQLLTLAFTFANAVGAPTTTVNFNTVPGSDPNLYPTADVAWSTPPTFGTAADDQIYGFSLNTNFPVDIRWNSDEAVQMFPGNDYVLWNVGNALPADHLYAVTIQVEV